MKSNIMFLLVVILSLAMSLTVIGKTNITFMVWGNIFEIQAYQRMVDKFNQSQNDVFVNLQSTSWGAYFQTLQNRIAANNAPDVFVMDGAYFDNFAKEGVFYNLTNLMKDIDLSKYYFEPTACEYNGIFYGAPKDITIGGILYYNKNLFDKAGLTYPNWDWTWQDWLDAAKKLTNIDANKWGMYIPTYGEGGLYQIIWGAGGHILNSDRTQFTLTTPDTLKGLQFMYDVRYKYYVNPSESYMQGLSDPFMTGNFGTVLGLSSSIVGYKSLPFKWGIAPIPKGPAGRYMSINQLSYVVSAQSKNIKADWQFIEFLIGPEGQKIMAENGQAIPALKSVVPVYFDNFPQATGLLDILNKSNEDSSILRDIPFTLSWYEWENMLESTLEYAWTNTMNPEKAASMAQQSCQKILDRALKQ
ncbi:ABC transporter substrate-binding protein [Athalassotoga sp.]|uniref:ABC transporter substrate-binding protein n=1 Tax=Athalassotoga sp. TaxID=2022597 RepID=UPI003D02AD9A